MSDLNKVSLISKFKNMSNDSVPKTIFVAVILCFFCSMIVSFAAVNLKSIQDVNKIRDKQKNILQVAGVYYDGIDIDKSFSSFQPMIVDLEKGVYSNNFDPKVLMIKRRHLIQH
jgi:Na+-transporting NADH:ubiquinone oxidoreductase subunit C